MWRNGVRCSGDKAEIGLVVFIQWRRNADNDGVHRFQLRVIRRGRKARRLGRGDLLGTDTVDVGTAFRESIRLSLVDVETGNLEVLFAVQQGQGQANIA